MAWETFKRQRVRPDEEAVISIQRKGVISVNRPAFDALGGPMAVELLYDAERQRVGLRRVEPDQPFGYPVRKLARGNTWLISGIAFTNYYGIKTDMSRRWSARVEAGEDGEPILMIGLTEPAEEIQSYQRKARNGHPKAAGPVEQDRLAL